MASTHILITPGTAHSHQLRKFVDDLRRVSQECGRLKDVFDQAAAGADWEALGLLLGITAAQAEVVYNLMGSVKTELTAANIVAITGRLG
jgi:hypothetical protein